MTKTDLTALPENQPRLPYHPTLKVDAPGDVAGAFGVFRLGPDGALRWTRDGINHLTVGRLPGATGLWAEEASSGVVVGGMADGFPDGRAPLVLGPYVLAQQWSAAFPSPIYVSIDGTYLAPSLPFYSVKGCTMGPLRTMAEAAGFAVTTAPGNANVVTCTKGEVSFTVTAGRTTATVNGKTATYLAVPATINQGRMCVPVRFFAESAGLDVALPQSDTIALTTPST